MTPADLPAVVVLADRIHVAHPESPAVFAERLRLFPAGCLVAAIGGHVVGYTIAHPGMIGAPPALDSLIGQLPPSPDCLYVHDIAIAPEQARRGLGRLAFEQLRRVARANRLPRLALVAVNNAASYWAALGFRALDDARLARRLAGYGSDARYMLYELSEPSKEAPDGL